MAISRILNINAYKTASRCWIPLRNRQFLSRQRCINFNNINETNLVSNDDVLTTANVVSAKDEDEPFEPTIFSSEEVFTAGPVNKA